MEDVLTVYAQPAAPGAARICMDERPCVLLDDIVTPILMRPGQVKKQDAEYQWNGTAALLLAYHLDTGQRYSEVRTQRTKHNYTQFMQAALQALCPTATTVHLVNDNLNTYTRGAFYEAFDVATAR